ARSTGGAPRRSRSRRWAWRRGPRRRARRAALTRARRPVRTRVRRPAWAGVPRAPGPRLTRAMWTEGQRATRARQVGTVVPDGCRTAGGGGVGGPVRFPHRDPHHAAVRRVADLAAGVVRGAGAAHLCLGSSADGQDPAGAPGPAGVLPGRVRT